MDRRFSNKIPVRKINKVQKAPNVNIIRTKRKVQVVQKSKLENRKDIILIKEASKKAINPKKDKRVKILKTVEASRQRKSQPVRVKNRIIKDANYHKIQDLKDSGRNKILIMIACGPSVLENDFSKLTNDDNIDIMVINKPLKSVWPPKYWAFCDHSQYARNKEEFDRFQGTLINSNGVRTKRDNQIIIKAKHTTGVSRNIQEGYVIGRSSVYANLQVAIWMNYHKIYIFGVDMCDVNGKLHHYGKNPDVPEQKRKERFKIEAMNYDRMGQALPEDIKKKIYFCSSYNPFGFLDYFHRLDHKKAIGIILEESKSISKI